jgi:energy-coupling factor transport system substrate-specific component
MDVKNSQNANKNALTLAELTTFAMLGGTMYLTKTAMAWIPNVHLNGLFIAASTLVYGKKALFPLYLYILLDGVFSGFSMWWIPYLYIWLPMWGTFMLARKLEKCRDKVKIPVYMALCGFNGLLFGTLYAPAQALMFGMSFKAMCAWIVAGLSFDIMHAVGNTVAGSLILPLSTVLKRFKKS